MSRGDFGIEAIQTYQNFRDCFGLSEVDCPILYYTFNITNDFYGEMTRAGFPCNFYWGEEDCWAVDLEPVSTGGLDNSMSDDINLFFRCGHSYLGIPDHAELAFDSNINSWSSSSTKWQLGDRDLDWLALYTCESINPDDFPNKGWTRYQNLFHGLHLVLGSHGEMHVGSSYSDVGRDFAENLLDGDTVVGAWFDACGVRNSPAVLSGERSETWDDPNWQNTTMANDHYWDRGLVMPDIPRSQLGWIGVWWIS